MLDLLFVFIFVLSFIWYIISISHPKKFPPGPRIPLPLIGDGYKLGMVSHKMSIITIIYISIRYEGGLIISVIFSNFHNINCK